jgi:aspartate/tyrosine/aromatic aminotransferase
MPMLEHLIAPRPDKILSLSGLYRADAREQKIDLGIGVYRDPSGNTPIFAAVREAEKRLFETESTKTYVDPAGDPGFNDAVARLVLGDTAPWDRVRTVQTPGGAGALAILAGLIEKSNPSCTVWLPDPTWINHQSIFESARLATREYAYFDRKSGRVDFDALIAGLRGAKAGDVVLLHGCCHNPTGADLSQDQWRILGQSMLAAGAIPLVDLAYQGFGAGLDDDAFSARHLAQTMPELMIAASCSKNFGIYRERTGAAMLIAETPERADVGRAHLAQRARINYSMPPDHGASCVRIILGDEGLRRNWQAELEAMRSVIEATRRELASRFKARLNADSYDYLAENKGMFSLFAISPDGVARLRREFGIYIVEDGRFNVAGLRERDMDRFVDCVAMCMDGPAL